MEQTECKLCTGMPVTADRVAVRARNAGGTADLFFSSVLFLGAVFYFALTVGEHGEGDLRGMNRKIKNIKYIKQRKD